MGDTLIAPEATVLSAIAESDVRMLETLVYELQLAML